MKFIMVDEYVIFMLMELHFFF